MKSQIKKLISIFACVCLLLTAIIIPASAADSTASYVKVTESPADWSGDYLIVYEDGDNSRVLNGGLSKIDAEGNYITVAVTDGKIEANDTTNAAKFTIAKNGDNYTIKSASGYYIGNTKDQNKIVTNQTTTYDNTIAICDDDTVDVVSAGSYLRCNIATSNGNRFRYYKSTTYTAQQAITLYKLDSTTTKPETPDVPAADSTLTIVEALALGASKEHNTYTEGKYYVSGEITEVYNTQYGNMKIKDAEGNIITVYGTYDADGSNRYDAMETKPVAGDTITVYGVIGQYNGTAQIKNGWITEHTPATTPDEGEDDGDDTPAVNDPAADSTLTIVEALALGSSKEHNTYTEGKYYVSGEITEVYNTQYGNMKIKDAEGNIITVYGTFDADGSNRYDAMETKPVAGDTITVYGVIGQYNGTAQIKNGWITEHTPATTPDEGEDEGDDTPIVNDPAADSTLTIVEALALGASKEHNTYTEGKYYVSGEITEVYNTQYGNMKIKDAEGNIITVYGTFDADGSNRYDAMETKPVAGDTITVYGVIGQYNGTAQIKNGWITEHTPATTPDEGEDEGDDTPVTPTLPTPDETNTLTITEAIDLGASQETSAYTADKYYVTGQITAITSDMYGNMYLADEDGNEILVYGTYGADGNDRYDALESKPDAGDTVTVYGIVGNFNGTPQLKNAWIIEFTEGELDVETPAEPEADSVLTIPEAIELGLTKRSNEYTTNKYYVTGTITGFYGSQGETYGNIYIVDEEGNEFLIYGTWEVLDEIRYDAMETKPVVGDTVTVYGVIGQYNGTAQMKNGVFVDAPAADDGDDDTAGDTTTGGTTTGGTTTGGTTTGTTDNNTNTGVGTTTGTTSPDTGDNVGAFAVMAIAAAAVVLYTSKKRV